MDYLLNIFRRDTKGEESDKMNLSHLSPMARQVTQNHGTEPSYSSPLNSNKHRGLYNCVVCNTPVFSSNEKYESGTGWPSFFAPYNPAGIATKKDYTMLFPRTEVHCAKCGAHFGHVFNDGPMPTGLRYCINGAALNFIPQ